MTLFSGPLRKGFCLLTVSILAACSGEQNKAAQIHEQLKAEAAEAGEVNLYSSRHYDTDLRLYSDFTEQTGIKVNRIEAKSNALIERMKNEGEFSPADLLITVDAGVFWRAEQEGVLQPVASDVLNERIPLYLRHPDGLWYGLSKRSRVIIYNKAAGRPQGLETYADLANPIHKGKVCIRSSSNIYNISLLASMISNNMAEVAGEWAKGVVANFARKPQSNDSGQIEATASGECKIALVNSYYLGRYARSDDPAKKAIFDSIGVIFPDQDGRGSHINISGAGVARYAPNKDNAIKFLEYLTSQSAQAYFADGNNEYPVIDLGEPSAVTQALGAFKEDQLNVSELGKNQAQAIRLFDAAAWQ